MLPVWVILTVVTSLFQCLRGSVELEQIQPEPGDPICLGEEVVYLCQVVGNELSWTFEGQNESSETFFPNTSIGEDGELGSFTVILESRTSNGDKGYVFTSKANSTHGLIPTDIGKNITCAGGNDTSTILITVSDCDVTYSTVDSSATATPTPGPPNLALIIGISVPVGVVISVLPFVGCCIYMCYRKKGKRTGPPPEAEQPLLNDDSTESPATSEHSEIVSETSDHQLHPVPHELDPVPHEVAEAEWYHGQINDREAEGRCVNRYGKPHSDGTYLVRRVHNDYYLYVCYKKVARKLKIIHHEHRWEVDDHTYTNCPISLNNLIKHHQKVPVKVTNTERVRLKTPVPSLKKETP